MGAFEYQALDDRGRQTRGVMQGDTPRQIRQLLRDQGLSPIEVTEVSDRGSARAAGVRFGGAELGLLLRQLATLTRASLPLEEALSATVEQTEKPRAKRVLASVRARVLEGHGLAEAMAGYPKAFPEFVRSSVAAGEQSGRLEAVLGRLADFAENRDEVRRSIIVALIYPAVLVTVAVLVVAGLLTWVVPQVIQVFERMDTQLPVLTRGLLALSEGLRSWGGAILMVIALAAVAGGWALTRPRLRERIDAFMLKVPLIGALARATNAAQFTRTLSLLVGSAVPVLDALKVSSRVLGNRAMRADVERAAGRVREGSGIAQALGESGYFPPVALRLIAGGERSGQLDVMLDAAADTLERQVRSTMSILMGVLEPALILFMGVIVLLIVLAILLPIFDLNQLVG